MKKYTSKLQIGDTVWTVLEPQSASSLTFRVREATITNVEVSERKYNKDEEIYTRESYQGEFYENYERKWTSLYLDNGDSTGNAFMTEEEARTDAKKKRAELKKEREDDAKYEAERARETIQKRYEDIIKEAETLGVTIEK